MNVLENAQVCEHVATMRSVSLDWRWSCDGSSDGSGGHWGGNWVGGRGNRDRCGHVRYGGHVGDSGHVRDDVLDQWGAWHQVAVVTGWAGDGDGAEHWRDDWAEDWGGDQATWLVPVGSCEAGLWDVGVGS